LLFRHLVQHRHPSKESIGELGQASSSIGLPLARRV
jgi:hypothetical protein